VTLRDKIILNACMSDAVRLNEWLDDTFLRANVKQIIAADLNLCINERLQI